MTKLSLNAQDVAGADACYALSVDRAALLDDGSSADPAARSTTRSGRRRRLTALHIRHRVLDEWSSDSAARSTDTYVLVTAVLQSADVRLLVVAGQLHLLVEFSFDVACERVNTLLSALRHLVTTFLVTVHQRQLHRLQRLHTAALPFHAYCCHMATAIKHPVQDRVKPSFVIFDIRALWRSAWASQCPDVKNYGLSWCGTGCCTHMVTVGDKGLMFICIPSMGCHDRPPPLATDCSVWTGTVQRRPIPNARQVSMLATERQTLWGKDTDSTRCQYV